MLKKIIKNAAISGFSLFEMTLTMAMFAAIMTVFLTNYVAKKDATSYDEVTKKLQYLKQRIDDFADANHYLPCPAAYNTAINDENYLKESRGGDGFCDAASLDAADDDEAAEYGDTYTEGRSYPNVPENDFVKGVVPCRTLGLPLDCGEDSNGNRFFYMVANITTQKDQCIKFILPDVQTRPYTLKILARAEEQSMAANYSEYPKYATVDEEPYYAIGWAGPDGVGAYNKNGVPNAAIAAPLGTYLNDNFYQAINHKMYLDYSSLPGAADFKYLLAPTSPLDTPYTSTAQSRIIFGDVIVYSRPSGIVVNICAHCRTCNEQWRNGYYRPPTNPSITEFEGCEMLTDECMCTSDEDCDTMVGERCNTETGLCQS